MSYVTIPCPQCNAAQSLKWARVKPTGRLICICAQCEAVWQNQDDVGAAAPVHLTEYLTNQGVADDWRELRVLQPLLRHVKS